MLKSLCRGIIVLVLTSVLWWGVGWGLWLALDRIDTFTAALSGIVAMIAGAIIYETAWSCKEKN